MARMVHEIRQASKVEEANANSIYFLATVAGKGLKIKYDCGITQTGTTFHECVRYATEGASLPAKGESIAREVLNETAADAADPVFTYSPSKAAPTTGARAEAAEGMARMARRGEDPVSSFILIFCCTRVNFPKIAWSNSVNLERPAMSSICP